MSEDGIEIHFDEMRGYLELACDPDAFAAYRDLARIHLEDFPEIALDKITEINIVDAATFVARRGAPRGRVAGVLLVLVVAAVLVLAAIGAYALITRIVA